MIDNDEGLAFVSGIPMEDDWEPEGKMPVSDEPKSLGSFPRNRHWE